jgi:F0F1-type ATP synthase membrane subunit c/vacuolar-type H+-ATPase subunit K
MPASLRTAQLVWAALLVALAGYLAALAALVRTPATATTPDVAALRMMLYALAVPCVGAIFFFRRQLLDAARPRHRPVLTTYVLCWALAESVALYGLVLGILARSFGDAGPFFVLAGALLLWLRPRPDQFDA